MVSTLSVWLNITFKVSESILVSPAKDVYSEILSKDLILYSSLSKEDIV
jgi:hypothetical protein